MRRGALFSRLWRHPQQLLSFPSTVVEGASVVIFPSHLCGLSWYSYFAYQVTLFGELLNISAIILDVYATNRIDFESR